MVEELPRQDRLEGCHEMCAATHPICRLELCRHVMKGCLAIMPCSVFKVFTAALPLGRPSGYQQHFHHICIHQPSAWGHLGMCTVLD